MDWNDLIAKIGKPVWDASNGRWRVLSVYTESINNGRQVRFTDTHDTEFFEPKRFFATEKAPAALER